MSPSQAPTKSVETYYALNRRQRIVCTVNAPSFDWVRQMFIWGIEIRPGLKADAIGRFPGDVEKFRSAVSEQRLTIHEAAAVLTSEQMQAAASAPAPIASSQQRR